MTRTTAARQRGFKALIVGGGVAGLEAMLALRALAPDLVDVELVSAERHFYYRPLAVAEPFGLGKVRRWELGDLARTAGADFSRRRPCCGGHGPRGGALHVGCRHRIRRAPDCLRRACPAGG